MNLQKILIIWCCLLSFGMVANFSVNLRTKKNLYDTLRVVEKMAKNQKKLVDNQSNIVEMIKKLTDRILEDQ